MSSSPDDPAPDEIDGLLTRALLALRTGDSVRVEALLEQALDLDPRHAHATYLRGVLALRRGDSRDAASWMCRAAEIAPAEPVYHDGLGGALAQSGALEEAAAAHRRALELRPDFLAAQVNLGHVLRELGDFAGAVEFFRAASQLEPDSMKIHNTLGTSLLALHRADEAVEVLERAAERWPESGELLCNLGAALARAGKDPEAVRAFRRALEHGTDHPAVRANLGAALLRQSRLGEAAAEFHAALESDPDFTAAHARLAHALYRQGRCEEALAAYERALTLAPDWSEVRSNYLVALSAAPGVSAEKLCAAHAAWNERHVQSGGRTLDLHGNDPDPDRILRVGYVSADLRMHPVGRLFEPVLFAHDRSRVEVFCYANSAEPDGMTDRLRAQADHWIDIRELSDDRAAAKIREDGIDVLVDLGGHTADNRLHLFARKPAPLQLSWFGYRNPSGLLGMDYHVTDTVRCGPDEQLPLSEEPIRMARCSHCYAPPRVEISVGPPPHLLRGCITFGSFNTPSKLNDAVLETWARILHALPASRIRLQHGGLDDADTRARIAAPFERAGIAVERIETRGHAPFEEYLAGFLEIDIALDPFPFHGGITTCDALWMGVPVVTLAGEVRHGRLGPSLLTHAGLGELVAETPDDYVVKAVELAGDFQAAARSRGRVREQLLASSICDARDCAIQIEEAYRRIWKTWCARST